MTKPVNVLYKFVDGAHFFVANDEASAGLCVSHSDVEKAFNAVSVQLSKLFKMNHNEEVQFYPSMTAESFAEWVEKQRNASSSKPTPGMAGIMPWTHKELMAA